MNKLKLICISLLLGVANAAPIATDRDTYVSGSNGGDPDTNYGTATFMRTRNDGGSAGPKVKDQLAFFSFDLSSFPYPAATSAKIDLQFLSGSTTSYAFELWGINDGGGDENFVESVLTFNNSSNTTTTPGSSNDGSLDRSSGVTLLGSLNPASFGTITFNSTDSSGSGLLSFINSDTNNRVTFIVYSTYATGGAAAEFATKENGTFDGATLTLVPETSSLILMAGALVLAVGLLRRR